MDRHDYEFKGVAVGALLAAALAAASVPAFAAGSATLQGDPISVAVGTIQFTGQGDLGFSLESPASAHSEDGSFVSAWTSSYADNSASNIYAHRFNADGTSGGGDIQVGEVLNAQGSWTRSMNPKVAADASGDFVVVWRNESLDGQTAILKARSFGADGTARSGEYCVDPACSPIPASLGHAVAMQNNGNFTVAYAGNTVNGVWPLYFRQFAQDGTALNAQPVTVYGNVTSFAMVMDRNSGKLAFSIYTENDIGTLGGGLSFTSVHLKRYYANGNPLGLPVTLGTCSGLYLVGVAYGCSVGHAALGSDASGNLTAFWQRRNFYGATEQDQAYLRHYYPSGYAKGARITVDSNSILAQGYWAENGAGNLIAGDHTGLGVLQVFDNNGNPLGDAVPAPEGIDFSTDTSSNFIATAVIMTYPPNSNMTTVGVQRYSVP